MFWKVYTGCEYESLSISEQYWQCTNKKLIKIDRGRVIRSWSRVDPKLQGQKYERIVQVKKKSLYAKKKKLVRLNSRFVCTLNILCFVRNEGVPFFSIVCLFVSSIFQNVKRRTRTNFWMRVGHGGEEWFPPLQRWASGKETPNLVLVLAFLSLFVWLAPVAVVCFFLSHEPPTETF